MSPTPHFTVEVDVDELATAWTHFIVSRYVSAAGYIILIWDIILTFPDEVKLVWPAPWKLVKYLYFFNRITVPCFLSGIVYQLSGLGTGMTDQFCRIWMVVSGYCEILSLGMSNYLLLLRLAALYEKKKKVMVPIYTLYILTYTAVLITATIAVYHLTQSVYYSEILKTCATNERPSIMSAIWIAPITLEVLVFVMTVRKAVEHAHIFRETSSSPVLSTLYRDGLLYFLVIIIVRIFNLLIWLIAPPTLLYLGLYFLWALVTTLVSRIFLNLRDATSRSHWLTSSLEKSVDRGMELPRRDNNKHRSFGHRIDFSRSYG